MNAEQMRVRNEAEFKARSLYVDLHEMANGDPALITQGLLAAHNIIRNDILNLNPQPKAGPEDQVKQEDEPAKEGIDLSKANRHTRRAIESITGKTVDEVMAEQKPGAVMAVQED